MKYLQKLGITSDDLKSEDVSTMLKKTKKEKERKKRDPNPYRAYGKYANKEYAGTKSPADYNKMMAYKSSSKTKEKTLEKTEEKPKKESSTYKYGDGYAAYKYYKSKNKK